MKVGGWAAGRIVLKRLAWIVGGIGVVLVALFGALRLWLSFTIPPLTATERLPGLSGPVTVLWDSLAVPHVIAASDSDLFAVLGYLHARDRLFQMDLLRHTAEGRLSEVFGARTVETDVALREREMRAIALRRLASTSAASRAAGAAYARGVNAWIAAAGGRLPPEFRMLRHEPEPWAPVHSIEIGVLEAWDLRSDGDELALARVAAALGAERARELEPVYPDSAPVIVEDTRRIGDRGWGMGSAATAVVTDPVPPPSSPIPPPPSPIPAASNAWVIGPRRTASGKPILANDPHLTLRAPSIWYLVGAHAPGYNVVGVTIPGIPVVVLGHSASVAWGFTNAMVDDVDYVVEQLSDDRTRCRTPTGWAPVEVVAETIRVKGGDPVVATRLRTGHGPVVRSGWRADSNQVLVLRWVAQDAGGGSDEYAALLGMGRARGYAEFAAPLEGFRSPEQNVVYADTAGTIAYFLAGRVPVRRRGDGSRPTAGWTDQGVWERYLTAGELPAVKDPARGWVVTANNRIVGPGYPFFIAREWEAPYRAQRIVELIEAQSGATAATEARHQMDVVDPFARAVRARAVPAAVAAERGEFARRLEAWDGAMAADSVQPTILWAWYRELQWLTYRDESPEYGPSSPLHHWLNTGESRWFDDVGTPAREDLAHLAAQAMRSLPSRLGETPWGAVHHTTMEHPLGAVPVLGRLIGFSIGPLATGGGNYTVNVASSSEREPPFTTDFGPSMRHVVDLGNVDGAGGFILPAGQSGNPASRHYRDQTARWLEGRLWVVPVDARRVVATDTLRLIP